MINLKDFCASYEAAPDVYSSPFSDKQYSYATDGSLLIRIPRDEAIPESAEGVNLIRNIPLPALNHLKDVIPLPEIMGAKESTCCCCGGRGRVSACPECGGEGELFLSSNYHTYDVECLSCSGAGVVPGISEECPSCLGKGFHIVNGGSCCYQFSDDRGLSLAMGLKLAKLPEVKLCKSLVNGKMFQFIFSGGCGVGMSYNF